MAALELAQVLREIVAEEAAGLASYAHAVERGAWVIAAAHDTAAGDVERFGQVEQQRQATMTKLAELAIEARAADLSGCEQDCPFAMAAAVNRAVFEKGGETLSSATALPVYPPLFLSVLLPSSCLLLFSLSCAPAPLSILSLCPLSGPVVIPSKANPPMPVPKRPCRTFPSCNNAMIVAMVKVLIVTAGFGPNIADYYSPSNSLMDRSATQATTIPLSGV